MIQTTETVPDNPGPLSLMNLSWPVMQLNPTSGPLPRLPKEMRRFEEEGLVPPDSWLGMLQLHLLQLQFGSLWLPADRKKELLDRASVDSMSLSCI